MVLDLSIRIVLHLTFAFAPIQRQSLDGSREAGRAEPRPIASFVPEGAVLLAEVERPAALWKDVAALGLSERIAQTPTGRAYLASPNGVRAAAGLTILRAAVGRDALGLLTDTAEGGAALAVYAPSSRDEPPAVLLLLRGRDVETLTKVRDAAAELAGLMSMGEWISQDVTTLPLPLGGGGSTSAVKIGDAFVHAIVGNLLLASNRVPALSRALGLLPDGADLSAPRTAPRAPEPPAGAVRISVDVDRLAVAVPDLRQGEYDMEPIAGLLFGGMRQALVDSPWISLTAEVVDSCLRIALRTAAAPTRAARTYRPPAVKVPLVNVPHLMASLVLHRDVAAFFEDHEGVVPPEFDVDFKKFNSVAGAVFGVRRIDQDVLARLEPTIQIVVTRPGAEDTRGSTVKLPAVGIVVRARDGVTGLGESCHRAFQAAVILASADRAQKGEAPFLLSEAIQGDVKITYATEANPEGGRAPRVASAVVPSFFATRNAIVLASTLELARQLAGAFSTTGSNDGPPGDELVIHVPEARAALEDNRAFLVADAMLKEGKTRERAARDLRFVEDALSLFREARVGFTIEPAGARFDARLHLEAPAETTSQPASRPRTAGR